MSEIKSLEKLREWANEHQGHKWNYAGYLLQKELLEIADAIQAEVDERYMPLPLDADGVPIRVGDVIENGGNIFTVRSVAPEYFHAGGTDIIASAARHHVKPRTVEDVLDEFAYKVCDLNVSDEAIAKYAAKLREVMGGDAE